MAPTPHPSANDAKDPAPEPTESDSDQPDTVASGQDTVQAMHDIFMREQAEPRDGFEPVPTWVMGVFGALLLWGGYYLGANSGDFRRDVFDGTEIRFSGLQVAGGQTAPDPDLKTMAELMPVGKSQYERVCQACHQASGEGDAAKDYPPLNGSEWVTGAEASPARQARILLYGLHQPVTVRGRTYGREAMPAQGGALRDSEIAGVLTYIRNSWTNKADTDPANPGVTTAVVKAAREKVGKRDPWTEAELKKLPLDFSDLPPPPKK
jgi:mono/diheme cytochrome c family protein